MKIRHYIVFIVGISSQSMANECDCTQITGSCQGSIEVIPTKSSTGLGGAVLNFRANASQCAKIEYWVDNSPEITVLTNGRSAQDSVWSAETKPFQPYRVTYKSCMICKTEKQKNKELEQQKLTDENTQSAIESLVNEASSSGSLEPSTYYSSSNSASGWTSDDTFKAITSLQSQLQQKKALNNSNNSKTTPKRKRTCDHSDGVTCGIEGKATEN